jgi:phosphoribosylaminoimidazole-succinocarboxamide synthase
MELRPDSHGKVRDIYDCGDSLLMVASDRISAFDFILPDEIPSKGEVLTRVSAFWFDKFADIIPNHLITMDVSAYPEEYQRYASYLAGRSMLVKKAEPLPIECIVRGYLTGSGKKTYDVDRTVCGIKLPDGLTEASKIAEPIFTPSTKAELGDHDENISYEESVEVLEKEFPGHGEEYASALRDKTLELYTKCADYALSRGIIIADTKFEFGLDEEGRIVLGDEMLTPDSSRFWPLEGYEAGHGQPSYDKQFVRDWLKANPDSDYNLPQDVIDRTIAKYKEAYFLLTGKEFAAEG